MPAIQDDLGFTLAGLSWVVNAYLIAFGSLLLLAGRLGDLAGRKPVFLSGIGLFTAASLAAGAAGSPAVLIASRFAQGVGSAMSAAVALGILVTLFTEPAERARAIAVFSFTGAAGASIGQVLGGVLTDALSWHWIFFINLPFGLAVPLVAVRVLPADRGQGLAAGADVAGAPLVTAGLMLGISTVVGVETYGWASARTLGPGALALALLVIVALHLRKVLGYGAAATGLAMLPAAVVIGAVSLGLSARLVARLGERVVLLTGIGLLIAALGLLARVPVRAEYVTDLLPVMLLAAGFGLALPALTSLGMSGAGEGDAGLASGLFNTTQQIGMALGVAVLSTLAAGRTEALTAAGRPSAEALTGGYRLAFTVGAALLVAAFAVAFLVLRRKPTDAQDPADAQGQGATRDPAATQDPADTQAQGATQNPAGAAAT